MRQACVDEDDETLMTQTDDHDARADGEPGRRGLGVVARFTLRLMVFVPLFLPVTAAAFTAQNGMSAFQTGPAEITVLHDVRRSDTDYWCAAGDFAQRMMGLPGKTRLWRSSPKPRGAGDGIVFTLDPMRKAEGAGLSHFGGGPRDGSIPIGMAVGSHCRTILPILD